MNIQPTVLIFSGYQGINKEEDEVAHQAIKDLLRIKGIGYKELVGCYEGQTERSFLVHAEHRGVVAELCNKYAQQCYLESGPDRHCVLIYPDKPEESIGTLKCVGIERPEGDYSLDLSTGLYWQVK